MIGYSMFLRYVLLQRELVVEQQYYIIILETQRRWMRGGWLTGGKILAFQAYKLITCNCASSLSNKARDSGLQIIS